MTRCFVMAGDYLTGPVDRDGCLLPEGHDGPHEFADQHGHRWLWETDLECNCEHCRTCEGDWCVIYWRKQYRAA